MIKDHAYVFISDVENDFVIPSLGKFAFEYDTKEIARRISHYADYCIVLNDISSDEYWEIVEECALTDDEDE